jgi:SAM-dependent methyltransferase
MNVNKICTKNDWDNQELSNIMHDVCHTTRNLHTENAGFHRKMWEWAIGMLALEKSNKFKKDAVFLGVGSGDEYPIFYLTRHGNVHATDLYSDGGKWSKYNASSTMLTNPDAHAPYDYIRNNLNVQIMSGTDLKYADNTFDGVFTYSSIEHFGGKENAKKCIQEIERVLKPGGVASIATEFFVGDCVCDLLKARKKYSKFPIKMFNRYIILNEMFTKDEFEEYILNATDMKPTSPIDYTADKSTVIQYPIKKQYDTHITLELAGIQWSSIHVALQKGV